MNDELLLNFYTVNNFICFLESGHDVIVSQLFMSLRDLRVHVVSVVNWLTSIPVMENGVWTFPYNTSSCCPCDVFIIIKEIA